MATIDQQRRVVSCNLLADNIARLRKMFSIIIQHHSEHKRELHYLNTIQTLLFSKKGRMIMNKFILKFVWHVMPFGGYNRFAATCRVMRPLNLTHCALVKQNIFYNDMLPFFTKTETLFFKNKWSPPSLRKRWVIQLCKTF